MDRRRRRMGGAVGRHPAWRMEEVPSRHPSPQTVKRCQAHRAGDEAKAARSAEEERARAGPRRVRIRRGQGRQMLGLQCARHERRETQCGIVCADLQGPRRLREQFRRVQEPVRLGRIRHEGSEAVPRNRTAHRHRGQLVEHLLPAGGRRQAPGTDDVSSNVHGRRRTVFAARYSSKALVFGEIWMSIRYKIIDGHPNLSLPTGKILRLHGEWRVC